MCIRDRIRIETPVDPCGGAAGPHLEPLGKRIDGEHAIGAYRFDREAAPSGITLRSTPRAVDRGNHTVVEGNGENAGGLHLGTRMHHTVRLGKDLSRFRPEPPPHAVSYT